LAIRPTFHRLRQTHNFISHDDDSIHCTNFSNCWSYMSRISVNWLYSVQIQSEPWSMRIF
jgi:hypothetical protein